MINVKAPASLLFSCLAQSGIIGSLAEVPVGSRYSLVPRHKSPLSPSLSSGDSDGDWGERSRGKDREGDKAKRGKIPALL